MSLTVYEHPDGGHYVIASDYPFQMKMDDGRWEPGVLYRRVHRGPTGKWQFEGSNFYGTTKARWADRFKPVDTASRML